MKKYVNASGELDRFDIIESQIEGNLDAYNAGYNLTVDPDADGSFSLDARKDKKMMPTFIINPVSLSDGKIGYDVELSFPNIYLGEDEYADDAEYWINVWGYAAKLATSIKRLVVDPNLEYVEE